MGLRDELARIGQASQDELAAQGLVKVRDAVKQVLEEMGVESAASFEITLKNGGTFTISSDSSPHLDTDIGEVESITPRQSGKAGVTGRR